MMYWLLVYIRIYHCLHCSTVMCCCQLKMSWYILLVGQRLYATMNWAHLHIRTLHEGEQCMVAIDRYSRQTLFGPIGKEGQERLQESTVTIIGCRALGTALANNLCPAGISRIVIAVTDYIALNQFQCQILFYDEVIN